MKYLNEVWVPTYQKAVTDTKTDKPTSGLPAAIAGLRYVRDALLADHTKHDKSGKAVFVEMTPETVRASFSEIIKALCKDGVEDGFLSNASAAAKAAGFKSQGASLAELVE